MDKLIRTVLESVIDRGLTLEELGEELDNFMEQIKRDYPLVDASLSDEDYEPLSAEEESEDEYAEAIEEAKEPKTKVVRFDDSDKRYIELVFDTEEEEEDSEVKDVADF
jgi:hypothetical protein